MVDADGFYFNVEKFMSSTAVRRMSCAEVGVYVLMLCQQWREPSRNLPDDPHAVADLIAVMPTQVAEVLTAWEVVRRKFVTSDHAPGRMWNVALERTRRKQRENFRKRRDAGKVGGMASAAKRLTRQELEVKQSLTAVERSSSDQKRVEEKREEEIRSEKKRPRFSGQRFAVFDWQHVEHQRILGAHADAFDLDGWYRELDGRVVQVVPKRDGGAWLDAQLMAEVRRRGLPMEEAPERQSPSCPHDPPCPAPGRWACQQKTDTDAYKASQKVTA